MLDVIRIQYILSASTQIDDMAFSIKKKFLSFVHKKFSLIVNMFYFRGLKFVHFAEMNYFFLLIFKKSYFFFRFSRRDKFCLEFSANDWCLLVRFIQFSRFVWFCKFCFVNTLAHWCTCASWIFNSSSRSTEFPSTEHIAHPAMFNREILSYHLWWFFFVLSSSSLFATSSFCPRNICFSSFVYKFNGLLSKICSFVCSSPEWLFETGETYQRFDEKKKQKNKRVNIACIKFAVSVNEIVVASGLCISSDCQLNWKHSTCPYVRSIFNQISAYRELESISEMPFENHWTFNPKHYWFAIRFKWKIHRNRIAGRSVFKAIIMFFFRK